MTNTVKNEVSADYLAKKKKELEKAISRKNKLSKIVYKEKRESGRGDYGSYVSSSYNDYQIAENDVEALQRQIDNLVVVEREITEGKVEINDLVTMKIVEGKEELIQDFIITEGYIYLEGHVTAISKGGALGKLMLETTVGSLINLEFPFINIESDTPLPASLEVLNIRKSNTFDLDDVIAEKEASDKDKTLVK